ncbi:MAG: VOC family protein [Deltaproteobacteria bacterium]|nr:VOC family protein [Deltaproteobacteria bacterium]
MKEARKLSVAVKPIPEGYHSITACMTVKGAGKAIDFYKRAFGAEELMRVPGPDGLGVMHAELKIGDSRYFIADEMKEMGNRSPETLGGSPSGIYLYVKDADAVFKKAVDAGAVVREPLRDMFWGDRCGTVRDPFGYDWTVATHKEDVSPSELEHRVEECHKDMKSGKN